VRALGLSRRMAAYYEQGAKPIPRVVALATRGLEHSQAVAFDLRRKMCGCQCGRFAQAPQDHRVELIACRQASTCINAEVIFGVM
jgi:hypothetical protein